MTDEPAFSNWNRALSRRKLLGAAGAGGSLLAVTALIGCGDDDDDEDESNGSNGGTPTATSPASETAPASDIPEVLVVANEAEPADLLPYFSGFGAGLVTRQIYQPMVEPRMTLDADGLAVTEFVGRLATAWEQIEPTVWRFTLREGVTFHNGEPWNAEAAKASFDALGDAELASSLGKVAFVSLFASGMEIVDEFTVDLTTNSPDTEFLGLYMRLGYVGLPPQFLTDNGLEALAEQPIGTGPYAFTSWSRGQRVVLERYEDYWEPEVQHWAGVEFITRPEASVRAQTVQAGEAHFAFNIGAEQAKTLSKSVAAGGFQSSSIRLNNTIAPTSDHRVREAINLALDRQAIVDAIFDGTADPLSFFAYQPIDLEPYPYDPERAAALIEEAGVAGTEVEMVYGENRIPEEVQLAEIYTASLEAIGLRVRLTRLEPQQYNDVGGLPFEEQPALFMETTSSGNYGDVVGALNDKYGCEGSGTYCNPEIETEWAEIATLTGTERSDLIQAIAERLHEDAPRAWVAGVRQVHGLADFLEPDLPLNAYILLDDVKPA